MLDNRPYHAHRRHPLPPPEFRSALRYASPKAWRWLNAPRPPHGATDRYALCWFAVRLGILLRDLAAGDGMVITDQDACDILGIPSVAMVEIILDHLRRHDDEQPPLTDADFACIAKST